jgi:hypothetical protein
MTDLPAWGHTVGLLELDPVDIGAIEPGPAHAAMIDRMSRYAWAFDERRVDLLADNFTADATWTGEVRGEQRRGPFEGRAAIVAFMSGLWPQQTDQRRHMILNHLVTALAEQTGTILSYHLLVSAADGVITPVTTGFYRVAMRREPDGAWRIADLVAGYDIPF